MRIPLSAVAVLLCGVALPALPADEPRPSLNDVRNRINTGNWPGITIIPARPKAAAEPAASAASAAVTKADAVPPAAPAAVAAPAPPPTAGRRPSPAADATPALAERLGALLRAAGQPPAGVPLSEARRPERNSPGIELPTAASAARAPATAAPEVLAAGVWFLPGRFDPGRQPDGNSLLLQGPHGLVIVDTGRHVEHVGALQAWMAARGQPLRAVINTHWHLDHLGGNTVLRRAVPGLRSFGSAALREAVERRLPRSEADLQRLAADPATDDATRRMAQIDLALYAGRSSWLPDQVVAEGPPQAIDLAGRPLRIGVERGVSGGDVWVLDEASGVLAVGDFVTLPVPFFDTACPAQWREALGRIEALPFQRLLPGHGPVMSRDDFRRYRGAFERLLACADGERTPADCGAGWIADLGPLLPQASQRSVAPMLGHYFGQRLRAAAAERQRFCTP